MRNNYKIHDKHTLKILASNGRYFLIDKLSHLRVASYKWTVTEKGYAVSKGNYLHRLLTNCSKNLTVDHINGDPRDNRLENLRVCTKSENNKNQKKQKRTSDTAYPESLYKGVSWHSQLNKWRARIGVNGKQIYLGIFKCQHEAAKSYNKAALEYFGDFARLNNIVAGG